MKNRILNSLIASTILGSTFFVATPVLADEYDTQIQEAQQQALENEQAANSLNSIISQLTNDIENTQSALNQLNAEIARNESSLNTTLENLQISTQEMEVLLEEISILEKNIAARSEKLEQQARKIQVSGNTSNYFEFILEAESLTDVVGRIEVVTSLIDSSNSMMEDQIRDQQAVEVKKDETERKIVQQNALAGELETASANLEVQKASQSVLVAHLALEKNTITGDREALLAQRNEALQLVTEIENEREAVKAATLQAEKEREERLVAEAAELERQATEKAEEERLAAAERPAEVAPTSSSRENTTTVASANSVSSSNTSSASNSNSNTNSNSSSEANSNTVNSSNNETPTPTPTPAPAPTPTPPVKKEKEEVSKPAPAPSGNVLSIASQYVGVPYLWTGTTPGGFDCSGFTRYVFAKAGKSISRTTGSQYAGSVKVTNPQPGDLVFFSNGRNGKIDHVGIVVGNGRFIGSQSSTGVAYASYTSGYWGTSGRVVGFGRY